MIQKKYIINILFALLLVCSFSLKVKAQIPTPANYQKEKIVVLGGTIHIGNGQVIENGFIVFENGKIIAIGNKSEYINNQNNVKVVSADDKHIYPGFINTNNTLGITEIDAVRATRDFNETGSINPNVRTQTSYNTDSKIIPTVRTNGVLITQTTPRGGLVSGQSSVMKLDAWNWEDATIKKDDGLHINWPTNHYKKWDDNSKIENKHIESQLHELEMLFADGYAYSLLSKPASEENLKLLSMKGLFNGTKNLYIHAQFENQIIEAVEFAKEKHVKNIVIVGGYDAYKLIDFLKKNNVKICLNRVHSLPLNEDDDIFLPFRIPKLLSDAEIPFCLSWSGDMEAMNSRNMMFGAGTSVAWGLPYEQAVRAITLTPAQILGIDKKYGSLEVGKSATLIISESDALDMKNNNIIKAFIDGREIDLNNHQKQLFEKYSTKYNLTN